MRRVTLLAVVIVAVFGSGVVLAAPSGVTRVVVASGVSGDDVSIQAKGPVEVRHAIVTVEPGGTTGWISWPGAVVATLKAGEIDYRNASEEDCAVRSVVAGDSFVVPAGSVFEAVNPGSDTVEVHSVAFLPPDANLQVEEKPAGC